MRRDFKKQPLGALEYEQYPELYEDWTNLISLKGLDDQFTQARANGKSAEQSVKDAKEAIDSLSAKLKRRLDIPGEIEKLTDQQKADGMDRALEEELSHIESPDILFSAEQMLENSLKRAQNFLSFEVGKGIAEVLALMKTTVEQDIGRVIDAAMRVDKDNKVKQLAGAIDAVTALMRDDPNRTQRRMIKDIADIAPGTDIQDVYKKLERIDRLRGDIDRHAALHKINKDLMLDGTSADALRRVVPAGELLLRVTMTRFTGASTYDDMRAALMTDVKAQIQTQKDEKGWSRSSVNTNGNRSGSGMSGGMSSAFHSMVQHHNT